MALPQVKAHMALKNTTGPTDNQTFLQKYENTNVGNNCGVAKIDSFLYFLLWACLTKSLSRLYLIVIEGGDTHKDLGFFEACPQEASHLSDRYGTQFFCTAALQILGA